MARKVRVRGKGYDRGDGTFGDLMITYNVKLPTGLNDKQKDLLRQMKDAKVISKKKGTGSRT